MRWSEAATLEFVKLYLKHECLWNPNNPSYKLKLQRDKAYSEICSDFNSIKPLTVPEVKMKIKNLRTTYIQQVHKILQKSTPDCIYEPSLIWFNEMDRCLKHIPTNRHLSSYNVQETPEVDSSSNVLLWVNQDPSDNIDEDLNPDPLVTNSEDDFVVFKNESSPKIKVERSSSPESNRVKSKKSKLRSSFIKKSEDVENGTEMQEDEFDIYGKYIASQLRKMNLEKALRLQLEIQSLVSEARISDISSI